MAYRYKRLKKEWREILKTALDSGEKTVQEIRHNVFEQLFVDNQDELLPIIEVNDKILGTNKKYGTHLKQFPLISNNDLIDFDDGKVKPHDDSFGLEFEMLMYLNEYEQKHKKKNRECST